MKTAQPWKHPQTGVYYLRRQIPKRIRQAFDNRELWKESLHTKDPAVAARRFAEANRRLQARFDQSDQAAGHLSPEDARHLASAYFNGTDRPDNPRAAFRPGWALFDIHRSLTADSPLTSADSDDGNAPVASTGWHTPAEIVAEAVKARNPNIVKGALGALKTQLGLSADPVHMNDRLLSKAIIEALEDPSVRSRPFEVPASQAIEARPSKKQSPVLSQAYENWKRMRAPSSLAALEASRTVKLFTSKYGDLRLNEISSTMAREFRDALQRLPRNAIAKHPHAGLTTIEAIYADYNGPQLAPATVKKRLGDLSAIFSVAEDDELVDGNPIRGVKVSTQKKGKVPAQRARLPFDREHLRTIFSSPLYMGCEGEKDIQRTRKGLKVFRDELYWCFLLGALSGARIEELAQLTVDDLRSTADFSYLRLVDFDEDQTLKNEGSRRVVPLHPAIHSLGLPAIFEERRAQGKKMLFDLEQSSHGKWSKELSRRANRFIDRVVTQDSRYVFHSLRHEFKDRCRESDIDEQFHDRLTGHAGPGHVGRGYGAGPSIRKLYNEILSLDVAFLDLPALITAANGGRVQEG